MIREPMITPELVKKILDVVDQGLTRGKGIAKPGHMCVEAAICYALDLPHSDEPPCVCDEVRELKIGLNDRRGWKNKENRAAGMRRLAIAQLGTNAIGFERQEFFSRGFQIVKGAYNTRGCGTPEVLAGIAEELVQLLIEMESPGAAFLDMCPLGDPA